MGPACERMHACTDTGLQDCPSILMYSTCTESVGLMNSLMGTVRYNKACLNALFVARCSQRAWQPVVISMNEYAIGFVLYKWNHLSATGAASGESHDDWRTLLFWINCCSSYAGRCCFEIRVIQRTHFLRFEPSLLAQNGATAISNTLAYGEQFVDWLILSWYSCTIWLQPAEALLIRSEQICGIKKNKITLTKGSAMAQLLWEVIVCIGTQTAICNNYPLFFFKNSYSFFFHVKCLIQTQDKMKVKAIT